MARLALFSVAVLALGASLAYAQRERPERPLPLLPDYVPYPRPDDASAPVAGPGPAGPAVRAVRSADTSAFAAAVAPRPRADLSKCLSDFWWGVKDSAALVADIAASCVYETVDEAKFLREDVAAFGARLASELRDAASQCAQAPARCASLLLAVARAELKPFALLAAAVVRLAVRLLYSAAFELLGCTLLPGLLPFVWNTLMDLLILGQCVFTQ